MQIGPASFARPLVHGGCKPTLCCPKETRNVAFIYTLDLTHRGAWYYMRVFLLEGIS